MTGGMGFRVTRNGESLFTMDTMVNNFKLVPPYGESVSTMQKMVKKFKPVSPYGGISPDLKLVKW